MLYTLGAKRSFVRVWGYSIFAVILIALLGSCGQPATTEAPPPKEETLPPIEIVPFPTIIIDQISPEQACSLKDDGRYICYYTLHDEHELQFSQVPEAVTPFALSISSEEEELLIGYPREDFKCLSVVANVALVDNDNNLVTEFKTNPLELKMNFTGVDQEKLSQCMDKLGETYRAEDIVPVYLDLATNTWKPFPAYEFDPVNLTGTIYIESLGDDPIGWGIPKRG